MQDLVDSQVSELRRGALVLSVLSQLHSKQYGYSLQQNLAEKGLDIEQGTLYPLLRRLDEQGLLNSEWSVTTSRPRKYYIINDEGKRVFVSLVEEWHKLIQTINGLLKVTES
ncbi:MAG: PadR family transcriptional regulator [Anaerolineae bacterium]|nr:PadR family transcriptional regulator [Anaerolineae bacterium]